MSAHKDSTGQKVYSENVKSATPVAALVMEELKVTVLVALLYFYR
jgi:hypothetical protein